MAIQRCIAMLGTYVEITVDDHSSEKHILQAITRAYQTIEAIDSLMSFHRKDSELTKINHLALTESVQVHAWTFEVLSLALDIHKATHGSFDCAIASDLQAQGLLPKQISSSWTKDQTVSIAHRNSISHMLLTDFQKVRFTRPILIDLGGIAKGYAVDRACESLTASGVQSGCVNAGGDLRVFGQHEKSIHLRNPKYPEQLIHAGQLSNGAIATSGIYFTDPDGTLTPRSALITPQTGQPIFMKNSFTVIARTCAVADGLTKALAAEQNPMAEYFQYFNAQALII